MKKLLTRDHAVWVLGFWSALLLFTASQTELVSPERRPKLVAVAAVLGFAAGKLGNSPLPGTPKDEDGASR